MLNFQSYDNNHKEKKQDIKLPDQVESIDVSYDGGRIGISINGETVFYSMLGGNDCRVTIDKT